MLREAIGTDLSGDFSDFAGTVEISTQSGNGFVLLGNGTIVGAYYREAGGTFRADEAVDRILRASPASFPASRTVRYRVYSKQEFLSAMELGGKKGLLLKNPGKEAGMRIPDAKLSTEDDETESRLSRILRQPGVIAVSAFYEGFAVRTLGKADFDQVAANAEDLLRAGQKISTDMQLGALHQLILETGQGKVIIAPYGDLNICVLTLPDTNLGLIRVALRAIQNEDNMTRTGETSGISVKEGG